MATEGVLRTAHHPNRAVPWARHPDDELVALAQDAAAAAACHGWIHPGS